MTGDPNKLKVAKEVGRQDVLFSAAMETDASRLLVGSSDFRVHAIDLQSEKLDSTPWRGHESYVSGVVRAGDLVVSGGYDGKLIWWEAGSGKTVRTVDAHQKWIRGICAAPDGKSIVSVADDMVARAWRVDDGSLLREFPRHSPRTPHHFPSMLYCATISADSRFVATGDKLGQVLVWELATGKQVAAVEAPIMYTWDPKARIHSIGGVRSLAFSPDGRNLAVGGMGTVGNIDHLGGHARIEVFDWRQGERIHEEKDSQFKGLVEHLEFSPDGRWLVSAGGDNGGFLQFHDTHTWKAEKQDKAPMHVHDLVINDAFDTIYGVGHHKLVIWEMKG